MSPRRPILVGVLLAVLATVPLARAQEYPRIEGWQPVSEVATWLPDNLWEYIDGAAELFLSFDVVSCQSRDFSSGGVTITVDLFEMGTPLNAFGIYTRERPETPAPPVAGAAASALSLPWQALLLKGSIYLKVDVTEGELDPESGTRLLLTLATALTGSEELPPQLALLPATGRRSDSEGYQRQGFLGRPELGQCLYATYSGEGIEPFTGFVVVDTDEASAVEVFARVAAEWEPLDYPGGTAFSREIPYQGSAGVVRISDGRIFGVGGAPDRAGVIARLDRLLGR
jgi:hypothetical protein